VGQPTGRLRFGYAGGDDPIFWQFKEAVGGHHWTPAEIWDLTFAQPVDPGELTVISWVLPQTEATKADTRAQDTYPAERWARARIYGEQVNDYLRDHVVQALRAQGVDAVAPMRSPHFGVERGGPYEYASTWSERHIAHAAGLGTFGLCDGLITPRGKAMRAGSVVARLQIPPTPRPYVDHRAYCLFFSHGICGQCIERCPVSAISESGHDKLVCSAHLSRTREYVESQFGFQGYGCGLCQTGVPCESGVPTPEGVQRQVAG